MTAYYRRVRIRTCLALSWVLLLPIAIFFLVWAERVYTDYQAFVLTHRPSDKAVRLTLYSIGQLQFQGMIRDIELAFLPQGHQPSGALRVVDLFSAKQSLESLNSRLPQSGWEYHPALLRYPNGKLYNVELRYRGDMFYHWALKKKSWRVKTKKKRLFEEMQRFNLIVPKRPALLNNYIAYELAKKMELIAPKTEVVSMRLNGKNRGIHILTEQIREELLRTNGKIPGDIYVGDLTWKNSYRGSGNRLYQNARFWEKAAVNSKRPESSFRPLEKLIDILGEPESDANHAELLGILDVHAWARYSAYLALAQTAHVDDAHNWKLYFDPARGVFEPVVWDPVGWVEYDRAATRKTLVEIPSAKILQRLHRNHTFLAAQFSAIREFFASGADQEILSLTKKLTAQVTREIERDPALLFAVHQAPAYATADQIIESLEMLRRAIEKTFRDIESAYSMGPAEVDYWWNSENGILQIKVSGRQPADALEMTLDSSPGPIRAASVSFLRDGDEVVIDTRPFVSQSGPVVTLSLPLMGRSGMEIREPSPEITYHPATYAISIPAARGRGLRELRIGASGTWVSGHRSPVAMQTAALDNNYLIGIAGHQRKTPEVWEGIVYVNGVRLEESGLIVRSGTRVLFGPGASLVLTGRLQVEGTANAPVYFGPRDSGQEPWGAVVLSGSGANGSELRNCEFEAGSGLEWRLVDYSAMLSLHDVQGVEIDRCSFRDSVVVDDMVHAVYSDLSISNSRFENSFSDALDIDISNAVITDSVFVDSGNDAIDLMTAKAVIRKTKLDSSGDKGISVGERSELLVIGSQIIGNAIGVQSKDDSHAVLANVDVDRNKIGLDAYRKNWRYGSGGNIKVYKSRIRDSEVPFQADKYSEIEIRDSGVVPVVEANRGVLLGQDVDDRTDQVAGSDEMPVTAQQLTLPEHLYRHWETVRPSIRGASY